MTWLVWLALLALAMLVLVWQRARRLLSSVEERASRPREFAHARLEYVEKLFRTRRPFPLSARVDRGYRVDDGSVVLVELKTRRYDRVYPSDVIQLSAQKLAVEQQTGQRVASHAYVTVERADRPVGRRRSHRVALLSEADMVALQRRRTTFWPAGLRRRMQHRRTLARSAHSGLAATDRPGNEQLDCRLRR